MSLIDPNEKVEYTEDGYKKAMNSLSMFSEEERQKWMNMLINTAIR